MRATAPLLNRPDGGPLFHRVQGLGVHGPVSAAAFLHDAHVLAAALPDGRHLANLCRDRYAFAVVMAAGLLRGRTALLNIEPAALLALYADYPGCTVAADWPMPDCPLPFTLAQPTADGQGAANPEIPSEHLAAVVFTSGSTGEPLPHPKLWGSLVARSRAAMQQFGLVGGSVVGTVPPQHMYGFELTVLLPLHAPVTSWCGPSFFPGDVAAALEASAPPRVLVTTPLQLRTLLQAGVPMTPPTACISATAPLDAALAGALEAAWDAPVLEIFGATECGSIASRRTTAGPGWTVYPGLDLAIGPDGASVAGPLMDRVALADVLEATESGFRLIGRRTDVVKLGGRRASLSGLTEALLRVPGVDDGAFLAPDDLDQRSTARLVAVVVAPGRLAADILADLRQVLDPVFLPRRVIQVDSLPRNAMGKLPRQALLRLVAEAGAA
jgi:acyl-coenzyme A synthetase/AMP-(fatty) acid ligase